jgi:hypothetical protein
MRTPRVAAGDLPPAGGRQHDATTITRLLVTRDPAEVERLADALAERSRRDRWTGRVHRQLVEALLLCLTSDSVRDDADAEDALCSALVEAGVMRRIGNLAFEFVVEDDLEDRDRAILARYRVWLPARYSPSRPAPRRRTA